MKWWICLIVLSPLAHAQTTSRVNVGSTGTASIDVIGSAFSSDGRFVAFDSYDPFLVPGVSNGYSQVNVHDRATGATEVASVDARGVAGDLSSFVYAISADGRFVVFSSHARNLVPGTFNGAYQVYVRDRATGTTRCASLDPAGNPGNDTSFGGPISSDGRFVVFTSGASNLVQRDTNGVRDVFVRDLEQGTTTRVSVDSSGHEANDLSYGLGISADGSTVLFESLASDLVPSDTNSMQDCFVRDLRTGTTQRVSVADDGSQGNGETLSGALSLDGRYVLFSSSSSNLVRGDTNHHMDAFVRDLALGRTTRVSLGAGGTQADEDVWGSAISADGRYVVLSSAASDLVPYDTNGKPDVFLLDRSGGELELASLAFDGSQGNDGSYGLSVSADGRFVAFESEAGNLVPDDDRFENLYVRDRGPTVESFCAGDGSGRSCPCGNSGLAGRGCENSEHTGGAELRPSGGPSLSRDSLVLVTDGVRANASCVLLQASLEADPRPYGDGLLCLAGPATRLYVASAAGNVVRVPKTGEAKVSDRSASRGALILPGSSRFYQMYYRDPDPTFCPAPVGNDWNVSNGLEIAWSY